MLAALETVVVAWRWLGALVIFSALYYFNSRGGWSGRFVADDMNSHSIGYLVPHSDAGAYFLDTLSMAIYGHWGWISSHRPIATAMRQIILFSVDYSHVGAIILQTAIISLLAWYASYRLMLWRGALAGLAFAALIVQIERGFIGTMLTEPLGMMWALVSIVFLIEALRRGDARCGIFALCCLTLGLLTRMGAMFMLAWVPVWLIVCSASSERKRNAVLVVIAVVAPLVLNATLSKLYATKYTFTGANFALVVCGISLGANWTACAEHAKTGDETQQAQALIALAVENFRSDPSRFVALLYQNVRDQTFWMPSFLIGGYGHVAILGQQLSGQLAWAAMVLVALYLVVWCNWTERIFWLGSIIAIWTSGALIFADDGWRTMHVTNAYIALLVACLLSVRRTVVPPINQNIRDLNAATIGAITVLMVLTPGVAHYLMQGEIAAHPLTGPKSGQTTLLAGRRLTGIAVFPDGETPDPEFSGRSMLYPEFRKLIEHGTQLQAADKARLFNLIDAQKPFGFVLGASLDGGVPFLFFVTRVSVLGHDQPWAWKFTHDKPRGADTSVFLVTEATPVP